VLPLAQNRGKLFLIYQPPSDVLPAARFHKMSRLIAQGPQAHVLRMEGCRLVLQFQASREYWNDRREPDLDV